MTTRVTGDLTGCGPRPRIGLSTDRYPLLGYSLCFYTRLVSGHPGFNPTGVNDSHFLDTLFLVGVGEGSCQQRKFADRIYIAIKNLTTFIKDP